MIFHTYKFVVPFTIRDQQQFADNDKRKKRKTFESCWSCLHRRCLTNLQSAR